MFNPLPLSSHANYRENEKFSKVNQSSNQKKGTNSKQKRTSSKAAISCISEYAINMTFLATIPCMEAAMPAARVSVKLSPKYLRMSALLKIKGVAARSVNVRRTCAYYS